MQACAYIQTHGGYITAFSVTAADVCMNQKAGLIPPTLKLNLEQPLCHLAVLHFALLMLPVAVLLRHTQLLRLLLPLEVETPLMFVLLYPVQQSHMAFSIM